MIRMKVQNKLVVSLIFALAGFMVAIQFQSFQHPIERDTRDTWEVRADIQKQQKTQQELYGSILAAEEMIQKYQNNSASESMETLKESVKKLKKDAGLTEITGKGVVFTLKPLFHESLEPQEFPNVSPELLSRFINELNTYGTTDISIANERLISISPIRNVNGNVYINNHPLPPIPFDIRVLVNNPDKLLSYMEYSHIRDDFAIEDIDLIGKKQSSVTLSSYDQKIHLKSIHLQEADETDGE